MADDAFEVVAANVVVQNIKDRELRRTAIGELHRVVKPAGTILVVDIQPTRQYRDDLMDPGAQEVSVRSLGPAGWFEDPFFAGKLVAARKPWLRLRGRLPARCDGSARWRWRWRRRRPVFRGRAPFVPASWPEPLRSATEREEKAPEPEGTAVRCPNGPMRAHPEPCACTRRR